jgi:phenylalanyl-tRNA synthetase beta chain
VNDDLLENFNWKSEDFKNHDKISNYMSLEQNKLRSNLVSSLIRNIEYNNNMNSENSYRFFEISTVFSNKDEQVLSCVVNGDKHEEQWSSKSPKFDKYDMTTIVEDISKLFGLNKSDLTYVIKDVKSNGKKYIYMTLSVSDLIRKITENLQEQHVNYSKLPYIRRDLSFVIDESIEYKNILKIIEETNVHSLKKTLLFDLYIGKNIPDKKKSLGIGFIFQDEEKTLTHEEADGFIEKILGQLKEQFKIELRK